MERQRLMSDGDSIGTAGSLGRASGAGDRRRWRKYGESSTLMVHVVHNTCRYRLVHVDDSCTILTHSNCIHVSDGSKCLIAPSRGLCDQ